MIKRLEIKQMLPITLSLDLGYKTPFNTHFLLEKAIVPAMPYTRPKGKPGFFRTKYFIYDEHYDTYICPNDETLLYKRTMLTGHRLYVSDGSICRDCPLLSKCTESKDAINQIRRQVWQDNLDIVEELRFVDTVKNNIKCEVKQ